MSAAGTLSEHFAQLFGTSMADSSLSERRTRMPWDVFSELMRHSLRPLANATAQAEAFWREWRLVALDGTQFRLSNTPQIKTQVRKARSRRGHAAFAKITTGVLLELGLHNPLAAAIGARGQSEWALALELLGHLPAGALLARERMRAADGNMPVLHLSFLKTLELMRPLWLTVALGADLLTEEQKQQLTERFLQQATTLVRRKRLRPRSCLHAVRQPVSRWSRLIHNQSWEGPLTFRSLSSPFSRKALPLIPNSCPFAVNVNRLSARGYPRKRRCPGNTGRSAALVAS